MNGPWLGPQTLAGVSVNEHSAMSYLAVWCCVNRISTDVASLRFQTYEHLPQGGKAAAKQHPTYNVIHHSPDGIRSSHSYWQAKLSMALRWGNSFSVIDWSNGGDVLALHLLPSDRMQPVMRAGRLIYDFLGCEGFPAKPYRPYEILHIRGMSADGILGYSPIAVARQNIGIGLSADLTTASYLGLSSKPSGVLQHPGKLSQQAKNELREEWDLLTGGPTNAGRVPVLQEGMAFNPFSLPAPDQNFIATRKLEMENICRLFSCPPTKAGIYDHATFSNLEQSDLDYVQMAVKPWADAVCSECNLKLFHGDERGRLFIRPNYMELVKADLPARTSYYVAGRNNGWLNDDEIRDGEDMNPLPNNLGQTYLTPLNMMPTERLGEWIDAQIAAQNAKQTAPTEDEPVDSIGSPKQDNSSSVAAVRAVVAESLGRAIRRETTAVRRAARKPGFSDWLNQFYSQHRSYMSKALLPAITALNSVSGAWVQPQNIAEKWVEESRSELAALAGAIHSDELPRAVEDLCSRWEAKRVEGALSTILPEA